jgi:hypothetical protein
MKKKRTLVVMYSAYIDDCPFTLEELLSMAASRTARVMEKPWGWQLDAEDGSAVAQALEYLGLINGLEGGEGTEMWANADSAREE